VTSAAPAGRGSNGPKVRSRRRKLAKGPRGFRQRGGRLGLAMERKLSPPVWSDRVAVGPVDCQLAGDHVAPVKLHLGDRDPIGPALAKLSHKYCNSKVYRKQSRIVTTGGALFPRSAIRAMVDRAECSTQVGLRNRLAARAPGCGAFFRSASRLARKKPRGFRQRGHWRTLCCSRTYAHVGDRRWQAMVNQR
jgi:hypothetical protein